MMAPTPPTVDPNAQLYRFKLAKLIRDHIPQRMEREDVVLSYRTLEAAAYRAALQAKFEEEVREVDQAEQAPEILEELADVCELIHAYARAHGLSMDQVEERRQTKRALMGGFERQLYGEYVQLTAQNPKLGYYKNRPDHYAQLPLE